ncbi:unnamed protein product [Wuchereria bancrofti]|uniref:Vacuolar protein sorting-associated protein 51 homolog n=1 Tax=Wuchereria bancrofti TaxID=6293 RepID=A0A3P7G0X2_WUCBA|nr:unnamed protein product [Wuchereria bancrofti]
MEILSKRMGNIAALSKDFSAAFSKHRTNVSQLSEANKKVEELQFLLCLPEKLRALVEQKNYEEAVKIYLKAQPSLLLYNDIASISDVYSEAITIMETVEEQLKQVVFDCLISSDELSEAINLLLKLGVQSSTIYYNFVENCKRNLTDQLTAMRTPKQAMDSLIQLMDSLMNEFEEIVRMRFLVETNAPECAIVVRALDHFYRYMSSCELILGTVYFPLNISMLKIVSRHEIEFVQRQLVEHVGSSLQQIQDELTSSEASFSNTSALNDIVSRLEHFFLVQIRTALASLLFFTASDTTFSSLYQDRDFFKYN